ncbi:MAG: FUSC family protein [Bryobacteraceae bacterium]
MALRNSLAVALPLGVGIAMGNPLGAVAVTTGALNVSYSDGRDPYAQRARRMLAWSILGAIAVFTGSVTGAYQGAAIIVAALWAFAAGMLVSISTRAGDLGLNTLVALLVFAARGAMSPKGALYAALLVLAGGLLQTGLALLFWPVRRYSPEQRAVGGVYLELSKEIDPRTDTSVSTPLSPISPQVQETLNALGRDHSLEGERFRLLFDQADRIRMSVFRLRRLRSHTELLQLSSKLLNAVGQCLVTGECVKEETELITELRRLVEEAHGKQSAPPALADEVASAVDLLAGQLRAVVELANHAIPSGLEEFAKREAAQPWRLQVRNWFGTLRANLDLRSAFCRHAIRLAVCVAIADAIGRGISWERTYWIPMTVAVVLKPDFTTTFSRGVLRLAGTFAGLVVATILYHIFPQSALTELLLVGAFTFMMRRIGPANYGVFSVAISGLIVFLIAATGIAPRDVAVQRALNTVAGGVLALIAYVLWPTWERRQVSEAMAEMLDACRLYFHAVAARFARSDDAIASELDETRRAWRRARSNAEASVDRVSSEPKITAEKLNCLTSMLASSHALVHAIMGLEAGLIGAQPHTPPETFETFANHVEFTLYYLSAALRGSSPAVETLPKLREDHRRMIQARKDFAVTDEFVLIESDRIATSLNTQREQVMRCVPESASSPGS